MSNQLIVNGNATNLNGIIYTGELVPNVANTGTLCYINGNTEIDGKLQVLDTCTFPATTIGGTCNIDGNLTINNHTTSVTCDNLGSITLKANSPGGVSLVTGYEISVPGFTYVLGADMGTAKIGRAHV